MSNGRARFCLAVVMALALSLGLAACGKRGEIHPPPGEDDNYYYPQKYPHQ